LAGASTPEKTSTASGRHCPLTSMAKRVRSSIAPGGNSR